MVVAAPASVTMVALASMAASAAAMDGSGKVTARSAAACEVLASVSLAEAVAAMVVAGVASAAGAMAAVVAVLSAEAIVVAPLGSGRRRLVLGFCARESLGEQGARNENG